jgi:hypothetical protein
MIYVHSGSTNGINRYLFSSSMRGAMSRSSALISLPLLPPLAPPNDEGRVAAITFGL